MITKRLLFDAQRRRLRRVTAEPQNKEQQNIETKDVGFF